MSIEFQQLTIENFKPFRTRQVLPLARQGLVLVQGRNRKSSAADANFVGKTSLFDALTWVLYGKTLRGASGDRVACRFTKDTARVELDLTDDGAQWSASRTRRPQSFELRHDGGVHRQEAGESKLAAMLGWGYTTFAHAAIFGQRATQFIGAGLDVQRQIFVEVLDLDFRRELADAKDWRSKTAEHVEQLTAKRATATAQCDGARATHDALLERKRQFETEKAARVAVAVQHAKTAKAALAAATVALQHAKQRQAEHANTRQAVTAAAAWRKTNGELYEAQLGAESELWSAQERHEELCQRLRELATKQACPTCLAPVATKREEAELKRRFQPLVAAARKDVVAHERQFEQIVARQQAHAQTQPPMVSEEEFNATQAQHRLTVKHCADDVAVRKSASADAVERLLDERGATFTADGVLTQTAAELAKHEAAVAQCEQQIERYTKTHAVAEYIVGAFSPSGIPNLVLEHYEPFLAERLAAHMAVIARGEAAVTITALERLKNGNVRERVTTGVEWADGTAVLDDQSGGQDRRVNLAIYAALQDLAEHRHARRFPVRVFDEPSDALDARGKEIVAEWVRAQAAERTTTFLITHDATFAALVQPDHIWTVTMDSDGSSHVDVE